MDVREKLVELLSQSQSYGKILCGASLMSVRNDVVADHLIANGVTVTDNNVAAKTECEYCQQFDDPCGVPMIAAEDSDPDRGIYLYNGFLCASGGEFCEAKVNFCPMCGRKLAEPPKGE